MSRRWMREFVKVNEVRLDELQKQRLGDPTFSKERLEAAEHAIDVLEKPEVDAIKARMAEDEAIMALVSANLARIKARFGL